VGWAVRAACHHAAVCAACHHAAATIGKAPVRHRLTLACLRYGPLSLLWPLGLSAPPFPVPPPLHLCMYVCIWMCAGSDKAEAVFLDKLDVAFTGIPKSRRMIIMNTLELCMATQ
jgi:hypothetical protein